MDSKETQRLLGAEAPTPVKIGTDPLSLRVAPDVLAGIPRRAFVNRWTEQERAIRAAHLAVENSGAHPLLTEAGTLLLQAFEKMADWHDAGEPGKAP